MTEPKIQIDEIENKGQTNVAGRDINIKQERPLTSAEEFKKARLLERKLLEKRVKAYRENLVDSIQKTSEAKDPYKGLYEYEIYDADIFFGRTQAIESILRDLKLGRLTVLQSESGAGKTSLIQAGILPHLIQFGVLPIYLRRPYEKTATECLKQVFVPDANQAPIIYSLRLKAFLYELLEIIGKKCQILVLIDQFEEFFSVVNTDKQEKFVDELAECLDDPGLNVHWLISLRTEYMGQLGKFQPRIHNPFGNSFLLNRLSRSESEEIIRKPAERFGIQFEDGLLDEILDDLGKEKIAPPQLQLVCTALCEGLEENQKLLTRASYQAKGGAKGILNGYLENVLRQLPAAERTTAKQILELLVTFSQQRALRTHTEIISELANLHVQPQNTDAVLGRLIDSRVLRVSETETEQAYELAHDYLLNEIKIDEITKNRKLARELLEQGVKNWKSHGLLLGRDTLELINNSRANLYPNDEEAELLISSAFKYQINPQAWGKSLEKNARQKIIERAIQSRGKDKKSRQYANEILWFFNSDLPLTQRGKFLLTELPRRTLVSYIPRTLWVFFVVAAITIFVLLATLLSSLSIGKWKQMSALGTSDTQCMESSQHKILKVTIDQIKDSNFAVYDQKDGQLCESSDSGRNWIAILNPGGMSINNILAMNNNLFVFSDNDIKYKPFGITDLKSWHDLNQPQNPSGAFTGLAINPKNSNEMIVVTPSQLFFSQNFGKNWTETKPDQIDGEITGIATDGRKIALATDEGMWVSNYAPIEWVKIKDTLPGQHVNSIVIYDNNFYAVLDDKNIYTVNLANATMLEGPQSRGEYPMPPSWPDTKIDVESLAATGNVTLVGNDSGLKCYPRWSFFRWEWWSETFGKDKPCQDNRSK